MLLLGRFSYAGNGCGADACGCRCAGLREGGMSRSIAMVVVAVLVWIAAAGVGAGAEWYVYPGAGTPIQDAIDGAGEGDTIYVHAGTYDENVNVWKRITLIGDGADVVTVRAADEGDHVFNVTADYVDISGFNVTGATEWDRGGICLNDVNKCTISNNTASGNCYGIYLSSSSNNNLTNNTASDNSRGIRLWSSNNNNLTNNYGGIRLWSSNNNILLGNTASDNSRGIDLYFSSNNNLTHNTANSTTTTAFTCSFRATTL